MLRSYLLDPVFWRPPSGQGPAENRGPVMNTISFASAGRVTRGSIARKAALFLGLAALLNFAAPRAQADEQKDPPTRVARVSFVDGSVSFQPGGEGDWGDAARNRPVTVGDKIWVDKDSRAELQAGQASIHLGSMTALSFLNLDQDIIQMRLAEGSLNFRVRELREGDTYEVDAPNLAFIVKQAGAFRIDVDENGDASRVTVLRGEGEVAAGGKTYPIHEGERAEFTGTDNIQYNAEAAPGPDGLDSWAEQRDLKEENSDSAKYVSRDAVGYSDLDDNGTWSQTPDNGPVWYPNDVAPGWAPYSEGSWNYVGPWGWTWVGYEPWGFAPYHYGRWNYFGGRWGWYPGVYGGYPIYGPAFVGFVGGGFGFGLGWFPLGFGEPFYPWFGCRHEFFERINERNTFIRNRNVFNTNIHNVNFVNAHNVNAVTVANRNTFVNGQAIHGSSTRVTAASLKGAQVSNSPGAGIKPTASSSLGAANMNSRAARPSSSVQGRAVVARTSPAQGASHEAVRTMNTRTLTAARVGNSQGNLNGASNRPATSGGATQQRAGNNSRTWEAQGNTTDRGRAPAGFGGSNRPANDPAQSARTTQGDRPSWARGGAQAGVNGSGARQPTPNYNSNRGAYSNNNGGSYQPPSNGNRGYSPSRSYSPPQTYSPPRTYSPPSHGNPAPSRSYSPPSHGSGGGGGSRGGGGGASHSGGGGSHGGGGASHGGGGGGHH